MSGSPSMDLPWVIVRVFWQFHNVLIGPLILSTCILLGIYRVRSTLQGGRRICWETRHPRFPATLRLSFQCLGFVSKCTDSNSSSVCAGDMPGSGALLVVWLIYLRHRAPPAQGRPPVLGGRAMSHESTVQLVPLTSLPRVQFQCHIPHLSLFNSVFVLFSPGPCWGRSPTAVCLVLLCLDLMRTRLPPC